MKTKQCILISLLVFVHLIALGQDDDKNSQKDNKEKLTWRKVKVVKQKSNVTGMRKVKEIKATAKGTGRGYQKPEHLERNASIILRKKAAKLNANYVLLTDKKISVAFGEIPSATLFGVAYTDKKQPKTPKEEKSSEED